MSESSRKKVLMIGENLIQTLSLQNVLEGMGYQIFKAMRGEAAILMLNQITPHLVILDWDVPGLSPLTITRMLRADLQLARIPIILTGNDICNEDKILALEVGVDLCLEGEVHPNEITARVRSLLRRSSLPNTQAALGD